jgi:hypothetical protein
MIKNARGGWVRFDINWNVIQHNGPTSYDWSTFDRMVANANARGIKVLGMINYTPPWARPAGTASSYRPDPAKYAAFVRTAVAHYSARGVHAYEIWNEPNNDGAFKPAPNANEYAALLKAAYPAVKAADPTATVVLGGLSPAVTNGVDIAPVEFLNRLYAAGIKGSFDALGHHPYSWSYDNYPGAQLNWSAWYQMYGTPTSLRSLMIANGDGAKKIWATEMGAPTNGPSSEWPLSEAAQATYVTRAVNAWRTYDWAGPLMWYAARDQGTSTVTRENFFGIIRYDFRPKAAYWAFAAAVGAG